MMHLSHLPDHDERIPVFIRVLAANGFVVEDCSRKPRYLTAVCRRLDEFSLEHRYFFVLGDEELTKSEVSAIRQSAAHYGAIPIVVGRTSVNEATAVTWDRFLARLGGPIRSWLPLDPNFPDYLENLGFNRKISTSPTSRADTLFEEYVCLALQFLLDDRVAQYGQERSGEALPDGVIISLRHELIALYDSKAYAKGYNISKDSLRQFGDYVSDFKDRYGAFLDAPYAFIVVSGDFKNSNESLEERSAEFRANCGAQLVAIDARTLGEAVRLFSNAPELRSMVRWRQMFSRSRINLRHFSAEIDRLAKDRIAII